MNLKERQAVQRLVDKINRCQYTDSIVDRVEDLLAVMAEGEAEEVKFQLQRAELEKAWVKRCFSREEILSMGLGKVLDE